MSRISEGFKDASASHPEEIVGHRPGDILVNDFPEDLFREILVTKDSDDDDGRSQVVGIRLPNGDLILGFYPQGDTYEYVTQFYGV